MIDEKQIESILYKLKRFEDTLSELLFEKVDTLDMVRYETTDSLYSIPDNVEYIPCKEGDIWGGEGCYGWFKGKYTVPVERAGKPLFVYPKIEGYEALLWVNGKPFGTFATKIVVTTHGNHYCDMISLAPKAGEEIDIAIECYAGHYVKGTQPFENKTRTDFKNKYTSVDICVKNTEISDFYFDLKTLNQLVKALDRNNYRRANVINTFKKVHSILYYSYENVSREKFLEALREAAPLLKRELEKKNSDSAPYAGLIGHSHMDTAWLWHIGETIKKCARTYSNQMSLMEQYPEHRFIQSSAYHSEMIKEHYPQLFEEIKKRVNEGRYEPNGGVWVECDCNITSGESMIRQFLWGQRFTRENFGYTADTYWLPDTFGYSPTIPQIMKGCDVNYFVTTKLSWNDYTAFPYDSFYWKGLDGTRVLTHFPKTHDWPCPETLQFFLHSDKKHADIVKEKTVSNMKLIGYGFGDGGGGPQYEMIEMARRIEDLEGVPRTEHITVSNFMKKLENSIVDAPVYSGELYLELHRGTLTNQHQIKRNNRLAEIGLHNLEYVTVCNAISKMEKPDGREIAPLMKRLLVNQFHDILPGTGIPRVHQECIKEVGNIICKANEMITDVIGAAGNDRITAINTLSFGRKDVIYFNLEEGRMLKDVQTQQAFTDIAGNHCVAAGGIEIPAFGAVTFSTVGGRPLNDIQDVPFKIEGDFLTTPFAKVHFDSKGYMDSFVDLRNNRELRGDGYALNTFLIAEDVPSRWDSWDLDADSQMKFRDEAELLSREVVSCGAVEFRIRSSYRLTELSTLKQDMIFFAHSPEVRFETVMDWNDNHRFLKTAFDTSVFSNFSREEVQFGYITRSLHRNTDDDKAKFEVSNHKYADISESRYGVAVLNDSKYGISAKDSNLRLSLHKGGCNPDYNGDKGIHECTYSFLPHNEGFSAEAVIKPAYCLNYKPLFGNTDICNTTLASLDADNIIIETVKPCEDIENGYIMRIYEAEGTYTNTRLSLGHEVSDIWETNMLEEAKQKISGHSCVELCFRPFEIKTLLIRIKSHSN